MTSGCLLKEKGVQYYQRHIRGDQKKDMDSELFLKTGT